MRMSMISVLSAVTGAAIGAGVLSKVSGEALRKEKNMSEKHLALFLLMNQWVKVKQDGKNLSSYFEKNGYKRIAVYGMSYAGETLLDELKNTGVEVAYGIDQKADSLYADVDVVSMNGTLEPVDAVVVTAITFFDEIEEKLSRKMECPIVSLEDILYEI